MFNPSGFCHIASNARNRQKWAVFLYKTTDLPNEMVAPGYFNSKAPDLNLYDFIVAINTKPTTQRTYIYYPMIVIEKTMDSVTVSNVTQSFWEQILVQMKADKFTDFNTPISSHNKGATMAEIEEIAAQIAGTQTDLTSLINTKATKATDFVTPIDDNNKGITQTEQAAINADIDRAATSGKVIDAYWFGKTIADYAVPLPTLPQQNYFDFTSNTPYTAKEDLSGWVAGTAIVPPTDIDVQILITSKFWNIPEQDGQQGGKAFWSHTETDWAYYPTIVSLPEVYGVLYPVGSLYLTTSSDMPLKSLIPGSVWNLVSAGAALWTTTPGNTMAGTRIAPGLPAIQGALPDVLNSVDGNIGDIIGTGALQATLTGRGGNGGGSYERNQYLVSFDASRSSNIYGGSDTVQPPAFAVYVWQRTA